MHNSVNGDNEHTLTKTNSHGQIKLKWQMLEREIKQWNYFDGSHIMMINDDKFNDNLLGMKTSDYAR